MSAKIKQEVDDENATSAVALCTPGDDATHLNVQVKQERELIIDEQRPDCQWDYNDDQSQEYSNFEYSIEFIDNDEDYSQDCDYSIHGGEEDSDASDSRYDHDNVLVQDPQAAQEADYKFRRSTESYKKIVDLQKCNYIMILCPFCDQITKTFRGWTCHLYNRHPEFQEEIKKHYSQIVKGNAVCNHCSQSVRSNVNHYLHYFTKHCPNPNSLFQCTTCKHKTLTPLEIVKHLDDKHDQFNDLYRKCPLCGIVFTERKHMRRHFRNRHHNEFMEKFNYICHLCKHPRFSKETQLYDHLINIHQWSGQDWETRHFRTTNGDSLQYDCLKCHTVCHVSGPHTLIKHHLEHEDNCYWYCKFCMEKCKYSDPLHLCNKMYRHFIPQTSSSKGKRSKKPATQDDQKELAWQQFEDYVMHCCPYCSDEFEKFSQWQEHLRQQHFTNTLNGLNMSLVGDDIQKLRCLECKALIAASFVDIYAHCFEHLPYKPYKCRYCLILMDNYQIALKHCINKCKENNYPLYSKEDIMFRHKMTNDASNSIAIVCFVCGSKQFSSADEIESHFKTHHNNFQEHFEKNATTKKIVCNVCKNSLDGINSSACLRHYVEHLGEGPFKCVFCQRSYTTYERCRLHVNRYHNTHVISKTSSSTVAKPPKVPRQSPKHVPKGLGVSGEKANILNEFSEFMSYACPECDDRFTTVVAWSDHIKSKHTFFDESNLSVFDPATGKNKCLDCNISLCTSVSQRQKHKLTHMSNRAFVCTLCNTRTTTTGLLYSHLRRLHFSEGEYECPICSVTLNNAYERSVHVIKTHPRSEWPESMCLVCYRNYKDLRGHMLTHDTDRPKYNCPICNVAIIYWTDLQIHVKKKHNQELDESYKNTQSRRSEGAAKTSISTWKREAEDEIDCEEESTVYKRTRSGKKETPVCKDEEDANILSEKKSV